MESCTKQLLVACVSAGLLLVPRLLLAGLPVADGEIRTNFDLKDKFNANGWISIAGQPPSPNPLAATSSPVTVDGDGANWEFGKVTLHAKGGLDDLVAKQVSLELGPTSGDNEHKVNPHTDPPIAERNKLPPIESLTRDVALGKANKYWAWANVDHRHPPAGMHPDWYIVGGTVSYSKGGVINTLATNDAFVAAVHGPDRPEEWPEEPQGGLTVDTSVRFDAELGILSILPGNVSGGVTPGDPLSTAWMQGMNFHFGGQNESGAWLFRDGHFALNTPSGDIAIEGALDELFVYEIGWGEGVLNRGGAVDGSQGSSPWMNDLHASLASIDGTTFHPPSVGVASWDQHALIASSDRFTRSTLWIPTFVNVRLPWNDVVLPPPCGDYNNDGQVDTEDYDDWKQYFGMTNSPADGDGDGIADAADYTIWRDSLGQSIALGSAAGTASYAAVPEPASAWLLLLGAAVASWKRRRCAAATVSR